MKLLREYIRQLLTESAKGPADLPDGLALAIARYGRVTLRTLLGQPTGRHLAALRGNVNAVVFSPDSRYLVTAAGEAGLLGSMEHLIMEPPDVGNGIYLSQIAGIGVATVWNYLANFYWTWRSGEQVLRE